MRQHLFGHLQDGTPVPAYTLVSNTGMEAVITPYGGRLAALRVPVGGQMRNVTLGFESLEPYLTDPAHLGAITGRYANRIRAGRFGLDGRVYQLPVNSNGSTLHGGPGGFAYKLWHAAPQADWALALTLHSPAGDQGFPGALDVSVEYRLDGNTLLIQYAATTDAPTVVNLTNHAYFNLAGQGNILDHEMQVLTTLVTPLDSQQMPNGNIDDISGTPLDFSTFAKIGARIDAQHPQLIYGKGYDICYALNDAPRAAAELCATVRAAGLQMQVLTTEPGVQFYTANHLGAPFGRFGGLCLETQHFADSPNIGHFPSTVLRPGMRFASVTQYRFSTL
jgi:aldose 1-epimerase